MKKINLKPDLILTGDWHLRETVPVCRTDAFWETQWKKVRSIQALQAKYRCPVFHSGDLFNHWKPSPYLLSETMKWLPDKFFTIYGNHDLPQHNLSLVGKSGVKTLEIAGYVSILPGLHWEQERILEYSDIIKNRKVLVHHIMSYKGKPPWPGCNDLTAEEVLEKGKTCDLILTGHNHKTFVEWDSGTNTLLVNPGSLTRQSADQAEHEPCVFLWYAESNTVVKKILPYSQDVITREHISTKEHRDERISAFISRLELDWEEELDFKVNFERFVQKNNIRKSVISIARKAME